MLISAIILSPIAASSATHALQIDVFSDDSSEPAAGIRNKLEGLEEALSETGRNAQSDVLAFYQARDYRPAWIGSDRAEKSAQLVRYTLQHAYEQGLRPADYTSLLIDPGAVKGHPGAAEAYDLGMTTALLRYAHDVRLGRFQPTQVYKDVALPLRRFDVAGELNSALRRNLLDQFLDNLPPPHQEYRYLVTALAQYRAAAAKGEKLAGDSSHASMAYRMQQIAANMERWRWMPARMESRYIVVDVPDQTLEYIRDGEVVLQSRVVIGKRTTPTPIMRTTVQAVIANPSWEIPDDVAIRQILPHLRDSHGYLAAHNIAFEQGQFRQGPGPQNGLGVLMLDSPNQFWVYMHDTPSKSLFRLDTREKSNGCVRVEKIFQLASLALTDDADAGSDALTQAIASGQTEQILLPNPLAAYMLYWTARADEDGNVEFHPDRYGRDPLLIAKLGLGSSYVKRSAPAPVVNPKPRPALKSRRMSLEIPAEQVQNKMP